VYLKPHNGSKRAELLSTLGILLSTESLFGAIASVIVGYDILSPRMIIGGLLMFIAITMPNVWGQLKGRNK